MLDLSKYKPHRQPGEPIQNYFHEVIRKFTREIGEPIVVELDHLRQSMLDKLKGYHKKTVLLVSPESKYFDPGNIIGRQWIEFGDLLLQNQIFNCDFYVITSWTQQDHHSLDYLNTNSYDWKFIPYNIDLPVLNKLEMPTDIEPIDCQCRFSHLVFTHRMHRQIFAKFLIKNNIHTKNIVNINTGRPTTLQKQDKNYTQIGKGDKILMSPIQRDGWFYSKNILNLYRDVNLYDIQHKDADKKYNQHIMPVLSKACFNLLSESVFAHPYPYLSEKTIQPMLMKRPFIMIGPKGNLEYLRKLGFKTFSDHIDESYDSISDHNERMEKIMQLVIHLNNKELPTLVEMVKDMNEILDHNKNVIVKKFNDFTKQ